MFQQSEYELTNVEVNLKGLVENSGYHVHIVGFPENGFLERDLSHFNNIFPQAPVEGDLEFPCEASTLYDHWNPRNVNPKKSPQPGWGSSDMYELGDLSGKFGTLEGLEEYETHYNDTNLPLFGYESILGLSASAYVLQDRKLIETTFRSIDCCTQKTEESPVGL